MTVTPDHVTHSLDGIAAIPNHRIFLKSTNLAIPNFDVDIAVENLA